MMVMMKLGRCGRCQVTIISRRTCTATRIRKPFGLCALRGESAQGGRRGGGVTLRRLGLGCGLSVNRTNDGICYPLEASTESEGGPCI
jgi:hypothetical protein